jgi:hypothetical protein
VQVGLRQKKLMTPVSLVLLVAKIQSVPLTSRSRGVPPRTPASRPA